MWTMSRIDLNADLGELPGAAGARLDADLLQVVTSANVACGGHAGDAASMRRVLAIAQANAVSVGAHLSYPDRAGFGRQTMALSANDLLESLWEQLSALQEAAAETGATVSYIKAHGALYHATVMSDAPAALLLEVALKSNLPVLTLADGRLAELAERSELPNYREFFADRAYDPDGRLRNRERPGAVLTDDAVVTSRVVELVRTSSVVAHNGQSLTVTADSVCVHGDSPGAVARAQRIRTALLDQDIVLAPFTSTAP